MTAADADPRSDVDPHLDADHDVVIVGGGPTGCSAGVFTARYGLDTLVFDRGTSSLRRCAHVENYLGFPAGVDVDTLYDLFHAHVEEAGGTVVPDVVVSVERSDGGSTFVVETQDGRRTTAHRIVAATRYDGSYLRTLCGDEAFERHDHDGEDRAQFDQSYPAADGRTPVDGLYVAAPAGERNAQAIVAAGHGAHVARTLLADHRVALGYPEPVADHWDWLRRDAELDDEWRDRDRWREWFEKRLPANPDTDRDRLTELRERAIDDRFATYLERTDVAAREDRGLRQLVDVLGQDRVLDALPDDRILRYVSEHGLDSRE